MNKYNDNIVKIYKNEDIKRIITFIPEGHRHIRILIQTENEIIVFQEATAAALVRAYINVKTHPLRDAIELENIKLEKKKPGYASYQLIESKKDEKSILRDLSLLLNF